MYHTALAQKVEVSLKVAIPNHTLQAAATQTEFSKFKDFIRNSPPLDSSKLPTSPADAKPGFVEEMNDTGKESDETEPRDLDGSGDAYPDDKQSGDKDAKPPSPLKPILKKPRNQEGQSSTDIEHSPRSSQKRKARTVSPIEALPSPVLQKIFVLSQFNCNLPICSPTLGRGLSSEQIFRTLTLLAFWDETESWTGESEPWLQERFAELTGIDGVDIDFTFHRYVREKRVLQQQIMTVKWFTLERMKALQFEVMSNIIHNITWFKEPVQMASLQKSRLNNLLEANPVEPKDIKTVYAREQPGEWLHIHVSAGPRFTFEIHSHYCGHRLSYPGRLLAIPDNRLCGSPWNVKKIAFLNKLWSTFPVNDTLAIAMSRRAVHQGIVSAMAKGELEALRVILKYNVAAYAKDRQALTIKRPYHLCPQYFKLAQRQENAKAVKKVLKKHLARQTGSMSDNDERTEGRCHVWTRGVVKRTFSKKFLRGQRPRTGKTNKA
ncbi:hypothetical protein KEM54_000752 [Ascosphaera aggregata]|nr:hypothetical protein KEM54_000752 [Ascosphaera aggregata]